MKKKFKKILTVAGALLASVTLAACDAGEFPTRDISVIVPWGAGGGTDVTVRTLVYEMGNELGIQMPISNMPGASGSLGKIDVYDGRRDGYRILGSSMTSVTTAQVLGLSDISYTEWYAWNAAFSPSVIAVSSESHIMTIEDLIAEMQANPGALALSSSGPGSSGFVAATVFVEAAGVTFNHIPYSGGSAAIIAVVGGEVDFTAQLSSEMIDFIRAGEMRALATLSVEDLVVVDNNGNEIVIPSLSRTIPAVANTLPIGASFGLFVPRDTEDSIVQILNNAYLHAVNTANFRDFVDRQGMIFLGMTLEQTDAYLERNASIVSWVLYDAGEAIHSPETFGIPRP